MITITNEGEIYCNGMYCPWTMRKDDPVSCDYCFLKKLLGYE